MFTLKVINIEKMRHQASGIDYLDVELNILNEEKEVVSVQKHMYDFPITEAEVVEKLDAILAGYVLEQEQKENNAADEANNQAVYDIGASLVDAELDGSREEDGSIKVTKVEKKEEEEVKSDSI